MRQPHPKMARSIAALKAGRKSEARLLLTEVVRGEPENVEAWIWLGAAASSPSETLACLKRALELDPHNQKALAGARWAAEQIEKEKEENDRQVPSPHSNPDGPIGMDSGEYPGPDLDSDKAQSTEIDPVGAGSEATPAVRPEGQTNHFISNLVIAILALALFVGLLIIAVLLYAWLG